MTHLAELWNRLRDRLRRPSLDDELHDELRFHREMIERDLVASGAPRDEARRRSHVRLGNTTQIREETRAMWTFEWLDDLGRDLRFAARVLRRNPAFAAAVVATLALGIGANTAIFSVVNAVILQPLPYANPDQLYSVCTSPVSSPTDRNPASHPDLIDWQNQNTVFSSIGGYAFNRYEISTGGGNAATARAILAMPDVYTTIAATPALGRLPAANETRLPVVAISYRLWQSEFGGSPAAIGGTLIMNERPFTVVGVMPAGFHFPSPDIDLWTTMEPLYTSTSDPGTNPWLTSRSMHGYRVVARLRPGVSEAQASVEMNAIMKRMGAANPDGDGGTTLTLQSIRDDSVRDVRRALWLTLAISGLVLLLACVNVAHLMLARASSRTREIAVRRALGADRSRISRQLLTESVLLSVVGGAVGIAIAAAAIRVLVRVSPGDIPRLENVGLNSATLAFTALLSIATGILFGVAPAVMSWRNGETALREGNRSAIGGGLRLRSTLTTVEVAFAMIVLTTAGLTIRSLSSLMAVDLGFQPDNVSTFQVSLMTARYPAPHDQAVVVERVVERLQQIPGVISAGGSTSLPPNRMQQGSGFTIDGDPAPPPGHGPQATYVPATSGFLRSIGVPLLAGRQFTPTDGELAPRVAIVTRELAKRYFGGRDPVGRRIQLEGESWTIVGVVGDVSYEGVAADVQPAVYVPWSQSPFGGVYFVVKSGLPASTLREPIQAALHDVDPMMNVRDARAMTEVVSASIVRPRFHTMLFATFAGIALVLAAVGIYGVIAYGVAQRRTEIGVRLALGAPPSSVVRLFLGRGMLPVSAGIAIGLLTSIALARLMRGLLFGISPTDAPTFAATAVVLAIVAAASGYLPSRRAARLDPLRALRDG